MPVTTLYALPLALILLILTFRTIGYRRAYGVSLGDNGDSALLQRMRVHANCAEYTPIGIVLMGLAESVGTPGLLLHAIGSALLAGRALHAYGMSRSPQIMALRVGGMILTITAIGTAAATGAIFALQRLP